MLGSEEMGMKSDMVEENSAYCPTEIYIPTAYLNARVSTHPTIRST